MEPSNRRWLLNGRRSAPPLVPDGREFLDRVDILLTYRQQLAEELRDVDAQLHRLWANTGAGSPSLCQGDMAT
jgi:hypothetical protein